jgi:hypothetical protein
MLALVFQGVSIQAPAATPEMLHANEYLEGCRPQWSACENETICLAHRTAPGIPDWHNGKHRYLKSFA